MLYGAELRSLPYYHRSSELKEFKDRLQDYDIAVDDARRMMEG